MALIPSGWATRVERLSQQAGSPGGWGGVEFTGLLAVLSIASAIFSLLLLLRQGFQPHWMALALSLPLMPCFWLRGRGEERRRAIDRGLPFALDLLTLVVEGGHDLATAIANVVERAPKGPLVDELSIALRELRMGRSRKEALCASVVRSGSSDLGRAMAAITQADRMGASVGATLRALSEQLRTERFLLAEKKAAEAPVKMLFPLVVFIFPAVFLVLFGPIFFAFLGG